MSSFGKTWWGNHWLRSLDHIDYDNRLPRGASYARNNRVREWNISGNKISAKVTGTRPRPYRVTVVIPPFFEEQVDSLMEHIIARPALISKLLNRELDPEILTIAEELKLKVFPQKWTDFDMQCSCPDWAVPCKHLAAVIYVISREIDNNPFLVFEIHQVDLINELKKRGILVADIRKTEIPKIGSLIQGMTGRKTKYDPESAYQRVDFSNLQPIQDAMLQLLPEAPPFYPGGDFREKYRTFLYRAVKQASRVVNGRFPIDSAICPDAMPLTFSRRSTIGILLRPDLTVGLAGEHHHMKDLDLMIWAMFQVHPDHLPDYEPSVAAMYKHVQASLHLLAHGSVVPQILALDDRQYTIRWLPAMIDARVRELVSKLEALAPPGLLQFTKMTPQGEKTIPVKNQTLDLLSVILGEWMSKLTKEPDGDVFLALFFKRYPYAFKKIGELELAGGIKVWLHRYFLTAESYKPLITVNESGDDAFELDIAVEETAKPEKLPLPLYDILNRKKFEKQRFKILQGLSLLSPFVKGLDAYMNTSGQHPITYNLRDFSPFLMEVLPVVRLLDIKVMLPKSLQELIRPKPSVKLMRRSGKERRYIRLEQLLDFDWQVALGDTVMSPAEFNRMMKRTSGLMKFKQQYIYVSEADMEKLHKTISGNRQPNSFQLLQMALTEEFDGAPVLLTQEVKKMIQELTTVDSIPLPTDLLAQLRPYQLRGFSWMYKNSRIGFGSMIADDMGLGKTVQVLALLLKYKEEGVLTLDKRALVVVPTGLLTNWQAEIARFAPSLRAVVYHGSARDLKQCKAEVILTTYGMVRSDFEILKKFSWQALIIDEAQNIKNQETNQSKAVKSIGADVHIAMSGTPVENRLSEFWSIMDFTNKGYLGTERVFHKEFAQPIQMFNDEQAVHRFRQVTAPFMMRRMKTDRSIISDLPDKIEQNQYAVLTRQQATLYEKTTRIAMEEIEGIADSDQRSLFKRQGLVLQMILALKQICNHPTQFLKNGKYDASLSGKMELLFGLLDTITDRNEKVLIFTQFKEMGAMLQRFIGERFGQQPMFYHGGSSIEQRKEMVERFQGTRADPIFILSLKAAGTGLNLTAASHVIHYDLWWNPAVETQATDRAYRIGQTKNVMVHRMITSNTFEERIDEMIQQKKNLANMTVATGENWIGKLSNKELRELFNG